MQDTQRAHSDKEDNLNDLDVWELSGINNSAGKVIF